MGVKVRDTRENPQKKAEDAEMQRFLMVANSMLDRETTEAPDAGEEMMEAMIATQEGTPVEEEAPQEEQPAGLMAKG